MTPLQVEVAEDAVIAHGKVEGKTEWLADTKIIRTEKLESWY